MKKVIALMSIVALLTFTNLNGVMAQDQAAQADPAATAQVDEQTTDSAVVEAPAEEMETTAAAPVEEGISPEVVAVIAAAVASMGYGAGSVRAIRPLDRNNWKNSGRNAIQSRG